MRAFFTLIFIAANLAANAHIFVYHRFGDPKHASTNISIEKLTSDFNYLKENGYHVIPLQELTTLIKNKKPIPKKTVVLTIDDSYKSFYHNGLPLFKKFKYPFTLFVYTQATQDKYGDFMTWKQLRDSAQYGELGLHSHTHAHLTTLTTKEIKKDTKKALELFIKGVGFRPLSYVYPFGEFDKHVYEAIKSFNFHTICNQNRGAIDNKSSIYDLDRIAIGEDTSVKSVLKIAPLHVDWYPLQENVEDTILTKIEANIKHVSSKKIELYLTGYGWQYIPIKDGIIAHKLDLPLKKSRNRVILKYGNRQSTQLIMRGK
jgi:poly-beta-1,6-N-acetyl-D-glucosamine N-deacetylase